MLFGIYADQFWLELIRI